MALKKNTKKQADRLRALHLQISKAVEKIKSIEKEIAKLNRIK